MIKWKEQFKHEFTMPYKLRDRVFVFIDNLLREHKKAITRRLKKQFLRQGKLLP